jgi:transcriptional regulator with XRE-family HTH domain
MKAPYQLLRAARVALDISHEDLAREAGVSERTLVRIEKPQSVSEESVARVQAALEVRGVKFLPSSDDGGPGIRIPAAALAAPAIRRHEPSRAPGRHSP